MNSHPGSPEYESDVNLRIVAIEGLTEVLTNVVFDNIDFSKIELAEIDSILNNEYLYGFVAIDNEEYHISIMPNSIIAGFRRVVYRVNYILDGENKFDFEWMPGTSEIKVNFPDSSCFLNRHEIDNLAKKIIYGYNSRTNYYGS